MYSFDVFDTLITRKTATPKGIFAIMEKKLKEQKYNLFSKHIRDNFYSIRVAAEELAHFNFCKNGIEDKSLEEIYKAIQLTGSFTDEQRDELIKLELETEWEESVPLTKQIQYLKALLEAKEEIVLISDMYLPGDFVRKLLLKHDIVFAAIPLYISSDVGLCKSSGSLFHYVQKEMDADYKDWIHIGDNSHSDVNIPSQLGIHCIEVKNKKLLEIEKYAIRSSEKNLIFQYLIGASANVNMQMEEENKQFSFLVGASIGGPILYGYVKWILEEANKRKKRRLYFIARDGYILKRIADEIITSQKLDISTFYIYGSRKAWRAAAVGNGRLSCGELLKGSYYCRAKRIGEIASIFGVSSTKLCEFLNVNYSSDDELSTEDIKLLSCLILADEEKMNDFVERENKDNRQAVLSYMEQEVDLNGEGFAFVEMAGSGMTQECLSHILADRYKEEITTFFFKLDSVDKRRNNYFLVYFPSLFYLNVVVELLARAPHEQTVGYKCAGGKWMPVLDTKIETMALIEHGLEDYFKGVMAFVEHWLCYYKHVDGFVQNLEFITSYLNYITKTPDEHILEYFSTMPNAVTGREMKKTEFAPLLSELQMAQYLKYGYIYDKTYTGSAIEYSILRSKKALEEFAPENCNIDEMDQEAVLTYIKKYPIFHLNGKVALFGAGKVGQGIHARMVTFDVLPVAWVDTKVGKESGLPNEVSSIEVLINSPFDFVVICVLSKNAAIEIREKLLKFGVAKNKIIWIDNDGK